MKKPNIGMLTFPVVKAGNIPLSNLVDIVHSCSNELYLITGNDGYDFFKNDKRVHTYGIRHEMGKNEITRVAKYIWTQLKISYILFKLRRKTDFYIFFIGGEGLILPILTVKLLNKKVISVPGDYIVGIEKDAPSRLLKSLININRTLSNHIILYSENLIKEWNLEKYKDKIYIAHRHFLDFGMFNIKKNLGERDNLVGYIGRLSGEKGVLNFVKSIPEILKERNGIKCLIGGDGQLRDEIEKYLDEEHLNDKVKFTGWIPHDELPDYLNELKLVVLPSYTEGLPNIILEAMACGTPVLATPVGAIPDVIKDGENGFIMENNSPECITENVMRALNHPNPEAIVKNARELVGRKYTYEAAVERYKNILENI
ncbi:Trehalose synthase [ANME-1 cluster archaeon GoMg2]|nr:Trehalose synthase [ANME-1 cluster archaeon GoMg2]